LVEEFLRATAFLKVGNIEPYQVFTKESMAKFWQEQATELQVSDLVARKANYKMGDAWTDGRFTVLSCDVQKDILYWLVVSFGLLGHCRILDCGRCFTFDDLRVIQERYKIRTDDVVIDSGYGQRTAEVYRACAQWCDATGQWKALKGEDHKFFTHTRRNGQRERRYWTRTQVDPRSGLPPTEAMHLAAKVWLFVWANDPIKSITSSFLSGKAGRLELPSDAPQELLDQLLSEEIRERTSKKTGKIEHYWKRLSRDNHWFDCLCQAFVAAIAAGVLPAQTRTDQSPEMLAESIV
jgi:hypothetical protein